MSLGSMAFPCFSNLSCVVSPSFLSLKRWQDLPPVGDCSIVSHGRGPSRLPLESFHCSSTFLSELHWACIRYGSCCRHTRKWSTRSIRARRRKNEFRLFQHFARLRTITVNKIAG